MSEHNIMGFYIALQAVKAAQCCGHTCAVRQRAAKIHTWKPMGKLYSVLLDAVKQRLLKFCSNVTKMTRSVKAVDVFNKFFKAANSRPAFYIELQLSGRSSASMTSQADTAASHRAFASVYILQLKCFRKNTVVDHTDGCPTVMLIGF